jgi:hypothetical protein
MTTVTLYNRTASEISGILQELKDHNMVANRDYEFRYHPGRWDEMIGDVPKKTEFTFREGKNATWFVLKWGS